MSTLTHPQVVPSLYEVLLLNIKEDILKNMGNQLMDRIDFLVWGKMSHLVNVFFCLQQKKEIHIGLEQLEGK